MHPDARSNLEAHIAGERERNLDAFGAAVRAAALRGARLGSQGA